MRQFAKGKAAGKFWEKFFLRMRKKRGRETMLESPEAVNLYLPFLREIIETILQKKRIPYEEFSPVFIDGEDSESCLVAAELLAEGLNHLMILTDHSAYFENYRDNMYEEQGLIVEIFPKTMEKIRGLAEENNGRNVILDFEKPREFQTAIPFGEKLYIPLFKKTWESVGNLDIAVPIGYNTLIVRRSESVKEQTRPDRLERAFYENK